LLMAPELEYHLTDSSAAILIGKIPKAALRE
jgi:hypothetical protein